MQFKKEWVVPTAIGVGSFGAGIFVGTTIALYRIVKGGEKLSEHLEIFDEAANERFIKLDQIIAGFARESDEGNVRIVKRGDKLDREVDGAQHDVDEAEQSSNDEEQNSSGQISFPFDSVQEDRATTSSEAGVGFSQQNELMKQAVMADVEEETMVNVFRVEDDDWDWDEQMEKRKQHPERPYIIHRDEYFNEERADEGFTQSTVTYYGGDGILCDESDVPIYEADKIVGKLEFGRGSGDPNVCYVRNERLLVDYEVLLEPGWFGAEVLGQHVQDLIEKSKKAKLEHSVPKFRPE